MIDWSKGTKEEHELASKIAKRAKEVLTDNVEVTPILMDIMAAHTNGCELRLHLTQRLVRVILR